MVALPEVTESNKRIAASFPDPLVAVFVGATSGVGKYAVKAFAKYARRPRVYIVGRSRDAASQVVNECQELNPYGSFEFIQADVSVLKNIDDVCQRIKSKETTINLLFESQGSMAFTNSWSFYHCYKYGGITALTHVCSHIRGPATCFQFTRTFSFAIYPQPVTFGTKCDSPPSYCLRWSGLLRRTHRSE